MVLGGSYKELLLVVHVAEVLVTPLDVCLMIDEILFVSRLRVPCAGIVMNRRETHK